MPPYHTYVSVSPSIITTGRSALFESSYRGRGLSYRACATHTWYSVDVIALADRGCRSCSTIERLFLLWLKRERNQHYPRSLTSSPLLRAMCARARKGASARHPRNLVNISLDPRPSPSSRNNTLLRKNIRVTFELCAELRREKAWKIFIT